jgi:type II secretory pathway pseudopilin PulG
MKMRTSIVGKPPSRSAGFTYVIVLAAVVIVGILAEAAYLTTGRVLQADREAELLFRGHAYRRAIESYHKTNGSFPRSLEDLLKDSRVASRRHIRDLYADPMAVKATPEWTLVYASDGGISGVASTSRRAPLKIANFSKVFEKFNGAQSYADWIFEYTPPPPAPVVPRLTLPSRPAGSSFSQ